MDWKFRIYTYLKLSDKSPKIITDHTSILATKVFKEYFASQNLKVAFTDETSKMLASANEKEQIVYITKKKKLPQFLKTYFDIRSFDIINLPLNGDLNILKDLDEISLVSICEYLFSSNPHIVISESNITNIINDTKTNESIKELSALNSRLISSFPKIHTINEVIDIANYWGKLVYKSYQQNKNNFLEHISKIDELAKNFIISKKIEQVAYASTASKPLSIDKILHHIKSKKQEKVALLCFDCMGIAEWQLLNDYLSDLDIELEEQFLFTLLPSVTSICRSSIFHGSSDVYDIKYPGRKDEANAFIKFFEDKQCNYFVDGEDINENTLLGYNYVSVLFNFFDELCHSAIFPPSENTKAIYFDNCLQYLKKSNVKQTIQNLLDNDYALYLCSDHGSVIAKGNGVKFQNYLIDDFAKRAVIIPENASELTDFEKIDIPFIKHKKLVLPEGRTMFTQKDKIEINHGGISLEEIVVPFITVKKC